MAKIKLLSGPKIIRIPGHANIAPGDVVEAAVLSKISRVHFDRFVEPPPAAGKKADLVEYIESVLGFDVDEAAARLGRAVESLPKLKVDDLNALIESAFA